MSRPSHALATLVAVAGVALASGVGAAVPAGGASGAGGGGYGPGPTSPTLLTAEAQAGFWGAGRDTVPATGQADPPDAPTSDAASPAPSPSAPAPVGGPDDGAQPEPSDDGAQPERNDGAAQPGPSAPEFEPKHPEVHPELVGFWEEAGGAVGEWGEPVGEYGCTQGAAGEGCWQEFAGGTLRWREGVGVIDCAVLQCVALTFDDGPAPETPRLLDMLVDHNVQATFFLLGNRLGGPFGEVNPRYTATGMEVGSHGWDHQDLRTLSEEALRRQLLDTTARIEELVGATPHHLRPPYGARNARVDAVAGEVGLGVVNWSAGPADWEPQSVQSLIDRTIASTSRGAVILLHDMHTATVDAVPAILDGLAAAGYTIVTVEDLFGRMEPGSFAAAASG